MYNYYTFNEHVWHASQVGRFVLSACVLAGVVTLVYSGPLAPSPYLFSIAEALSCIVGLNCAAATGWG